MTRKELAQVKADYEAELRAAIETNIDIINYVALACLSLANEMCYNHHERGQRLWAFAQALKGLEMEETRCPACKQRARCPAYNTGVSYPCPYFKEDDHDQEE